MFANLLALARMAAGRIAEAVPVHQDLVERVPDMSFPVSSLLRAHAFQKNWAAVDRLLELAAKRQLRSALGLVEFWLAMGKWPDCAGEVPYDFKVECAKAQHIPKEDFVL